MNSVLTQISMEFLIAVHASASSLHDCRHFLAFFSHFVFKINRMRVNSVLHEADCLTLSASGFFCYL